MAAARLLARHLMWLPDEGISQSRRAVSCRIPTGGSTVTQQSEYHHISRIDQESKNQHGWYVRMRFRGQAISRFFSDQKYEGKELALRAAQDWRDRTFKE